MIFWISCIYSALIIKVGLFIKMFKQFDQFDEKITNN